MYFITINSSEIKITPKLGRIFFSAYLGEEEVLDEKKKVMKKKENKYGQENERLAESIK